MSCPEQCLALGLHLCEQSILMMMMLVSILNDGDIDIVWDAGRVRGYAMLSNLDFCRACVFLGICPDTDRCSCRWPIDMCSCLMDL